MLCRLLLGAIFILYLICVLILSGVQKEDLDMSLLTRLEHYDINISNATNNVTFLEDCLTTVNNAPNSLNETDKPIMKSNSNLAILLTTHSPIRNENQPKTHDEIEIDLDSEPELNNQFPNITNSKVNQKSVQDILKLWESYVTPTSEDAENFSKEIVEFESTTDKALKIHQATDYVNITNSMYQNFQSQVTKKDVDDYITKQFEKYLDNITEPKNVVAKTRRIEVKLDKKRKQAKISFDSKGIKKYFVKFPVSTEVVTTTVTATSVAPVAVDKLVISDTIIDKIAKSVKNMVIEDLRKEFQPFRYQLPSSTTITDLSTLSTLSSTRLTTSKTSTTVETTTIRSNYIPDNPTSLLARTFTKEHFLALEKFLEIFRLQNQDRLSSTSSIKQPGNLNYPHAQQPLSKGYPTNFNNVHIKNNDPMVLFKPIYTGAQPNIVSPQYNTNNYNNPPYKGNPKVVFTLQSDIEDIPPLRVPNKGVHVLQNIIVSTKSPESRQNAKQRWWKSKKLSYPYHRHVTIGPATSSLYDPSGMNSDNFPSGAPIRMSKGKMYKHVASPYGYHANGHRQCTPHYSVRQRNPDTVAKYHELLEFGPEYTSGLERPDESQDDGSSHAVRLQHPLTHKKSYNGGPFKKIMQTQQKVNDMLEKILEMNKYPNDNTNEGINQF